MKQKQLQLLKMAVILLFTINYQISTVQAQPSEEIQKLLAGDGAAYDYFGYSVNISGNYAIVGAYSDDANGSAYIFYNNAGTWEQQAKLIASDGAYDDLFGYSVSISGNYAVVGAYLDDDKGSKSGSAYIFYNNAGIWQQQAKLTASDGAAEDYFGYSVSIFGNYAVVGAYFDDDNGSNSGSAYIFYNNDGTWEQQSKLLASDGSAGDLFGCSVSIFVNYVAVGAGFDDGNGINSGAAYIFNNNSGSWQQQAKLTASDGYENDQFGCSVNISGDYTVVGAHYDDNNGSYSGSAYIFYNNAGTWQQQTKITPSDGAANDRFGCSVCISGNYALIGAYDDDDYGEKSGSAYIFFNDAGTWEQQAKLTASDGAADDLFGWSVSISGNYALVGAYGDDDNGSVSGSAYIFGTPMPVVTSQPEDQINICPGETATYSVTGDYTDSYQWQESTDSGNSWTDLFGNDIYSGTSSTTLTVTASLSLNNYLYRCVLTNNNGSITSNTAVLQTDNNDPVPDVSVLSDVNAECDVTSLDAQTATDNCAGLITGTHNAILPITTQGTTIVTWAYDDGNGNISVQTQNVVINDITAPNITCQENQDVTAEENGYYTVQGAEFDPLSSDDNCTVAGTENDFNNSNTLEGAQFPEGTTTVTWTVTDDAGNTNTCSFDVNVAEYVGIEKLYDASITISPNPAGNFITVKSTDYSIESVTISDITGKYIVNKQFDNTMQAEIDLSGLVSGIYLLYIKTDKTILTQKVIKN